MRQQGFAARHFIMKLGYTAKLSVFPCCLPCKCCDFPKDLMLN